MANRIIPTETKVNVMNQCLTLQNIELVAKESGVAPNSIRNWFATKVLPGLPEALAKENPGPKPNAVSTRPALPALAGRPGSVSKGKRAALSAEVEERPDHCGTILSEFTGLEEWAVLGNQLVGISERALVQPETRSNPTTSLWDLRPRDRLTSTTEAGSSATTRLAILQTVGGVQQIQVGVVQPSHCPAGGLCLWSGGLGHICQRRNARGRAEGASDA